MSNNFEGTEALKQANLNLRQDIETCVQKLIDVDFSVEGFFESLGKSLDIDFDLGETIKLSKFNNHKEKIVFVFSELNKKISDLENDGNKKVIDDLKDIVSNLQKDLPEELREFLSGDNNKVVLEMVGEFASNIISLVEDCNSSENKSKIIYLKSEIKNLGIVFDLSGLEGFNQNIINENEELKKRSESFNELKKPFEDKIIENQNSFNEEVENIENLINKEKIKVESERNKIKEVLKSLVSNSKGIIPEGFLTEGEKNELFSGLGNLEKINNSKNILELNSAYDLQIEILKGIDSKIIEKLNSKLDTIKDLNGEDKFDGKFNEYIKKIEDVVRNYKGLLGYNYELYSLDKVKTIKKEEKVVDQKKEVQKERIIKGRKVSEIKEYSNRNLKKVRKDVTPKDTKDQVLKYTETEYTYKNIKTENFEIGNGAIENNIGKKDFLKNAFDNFNKFNECFELEKKNLDDLINESYLRVDDLDFGDLEDDLKEEKENGCCEDFLDLVQYVVDNKEDVKNNLKNQSVKNEKYVSILNNIIDGFEGLNSVSDFKEVKKNNSIFKTFIEELKDKDINTGKDELEKDEFSEVVKEDEEGEIDGETSDIDFDDLDDEEEDAAKVYDEAIEEDKNVDAKVEEIDNFIKDINTQKESLENLSIEIQLSIERFKDKIKNINLENIEIKDINNLIDDIKNIKNELKTEISKQENEFKKLDFTIKALLDLGVEEIPTYLTNKLNKYNASVENIKKILGETEGKLNELKSLEKEIDKKLDGVEAEKTKVINQTIELEKIKKLDEDGNIDDNEGGSENPTEATIFENAKKNFTDNFLLKLNEHKKYFKFSDKITETEEDVFEKYLKKCDNKEKVNKFKEKINKILEIRDKEIENRGKGRKIFNLIGFGKLTDKSLKDELKDFEI